jgi:hypothetical protein
MGELARVEEIDKRKIENKGDTLSNLQDLFRKLTEKDGEKIPF